MHNSTIVQLNRLNAHFYQTVATTFAETRQTPWPGWQKSWEVIAEKLLPKGTSSLAICDVGCGNGRFAQFCLDQLQNQVALDYLGIDQSSNLLAEAEKSLEQQPAFPQTLSQIIRFKQLDVIELLINKGSLSDAIALQFPLVTAFGLFHHIPSQGLRIQLIQQLAELLSPGGLLIITFWQFQFNEALMARQVSPEKAGFQATDLEVNDYFLTWERGQQAIRYCHLTDTPEQNLLICHSGLRVLSYFAADGKTGQDNSYYILQKI